MRSRAFSKPIRRVVLAAGLAALHAPILSAAEVRNTSCVACHGDSDFFDEESLAILSAFRDDVHADVGLSCHDCHGGNPATAVADDFEAAMDEAFSLNPYRGAPSRVGVPGFCGHCHSSPTYMKRFRPDARTDQEREYETSHHGELLAAGDTRVATCTDCHGVHGIRRVEDPESFVYPTKVADTCGACHSSAEHMAGYTLSDGRPLPINQQARWSRSVHATAMFERDDLSAPTCNDCHGNHGATPPGLDSVTFVCGQCHGREAGLFRGSPKHEGFERHNEYLADLDDEGCPACHEPPEPQAWVSGIRRFGECTSCHDNHGTVRPTIAMFGALPDYPCVSCHENPGIITAEVEEPEDSGQHYSEVLERLLDEATDRGLEGVALFDWMVDRTHSLSEHALPGEFDEAGQPVLRPEFSRLFDKFRIGKTYYTYRDPETGQEVEAPITRCNSCHVTGAMVSDATPGAVTGIDLVGRMNELTALTARAERILLATRRGGVEIRDALIDVDQAINSQISLEVLVHGFSAAAESEFIEAYEAGLGHARTAIEKGLVAREEIHARRRWLAFSLLAVVATLVGLGVKIHQLSRREQEAARAGGPASPTPAAG